MSYVEIESVSSPPRASLTRAKSRPDVRKTVRQERLERFAAILERHDTALSLLTGIEYAPWEERRFLREERSPLSVAFEDEVFRRQGLSGDRLGDVMDFFELNEREAHHLLCYCHYASSVTSTMVADRARRLAAKRTLRQHLEGLRHRLFGAA